MRAEATTEKKDIFQRVTDQIVEAIEAGTESYKMPWKTSGGFPYSPINAVIKAAVPRNQHRDSLGNRSEERLHVRNLGNIQAVARDGRTSSKGREVRSRSVLEVLRPRTTDGQAKASTSKAGKIPMAKDYWIFNADQVDGYEKSEEQPASRAERIEQAEAFFQISWSCAAARRKPGILLPGYRHGSHAGV